MAATHVPIGGQQVLTFRLGDQRYCVDIETVDEIVDHRSRVTPVPGTPTHVEGVVDLRGQTTTVVSPRHVLGLDGVGNEERIVIFRDEAGTVGWLVDEVEQVLDVADDQFESDFASDRVRGVLKREEEFVVWLDPTGFDAD